MKEGDDITITCLPSSLTVAVEWDMQISATPLTGEGNVEYDEPLRQRIVIRDVDTSHEGNYTCRVVGDADGVIPSATAVVKVRQSKR